MAGRDDRWARTTGVQFETHFSLAAVHRLCEPFTHLLPRLPDPQREALEVAFGTRAGTAGDALHQALAVLNLLTTAAEDGPLVCVVDDAQWLDDASAKCLTFVARRLAEEPVAFLFAAPVGVPELADLPQVTLSGLSEPDARSLLTSQVLAPLDRPVRERILAEAAGNPLALLELSHGSVDVAGGFAVPRAGSSTSAIELSFLRRLQRLPADGQLLVLTAAAEPLGDLQVLRRAAGHLGIPFEALDDAERADLLAVGPPVRFQHPLVRSAVYRAAPTGQRRTVHRALSAATDPHSDPERRVWHLAQATEAPDEEVAAGLAGSAQRAQSRGGLAAAAAFLERAAELSPHPRLRAERTVLAAEAHLQAGAFDAAQRLTAALELASTDEPVAARTELLRGTLAFTQHRAAEAPRHLIAAARRLAGFDVAASRQCYLDVVQAVLVTARSAAEMAEGLRAVQSAPPTASAGSQVDVVLDAVTGLLAAQPGSVEAVRSLINGQDLSVWVRWPALASFLAIEVWDAQAWVRLAEHQQAAARALGRLALLPSSLSLLANARLHTGDVTGAEALLAEEDAVTQITGAAPLAFARLHVAAVRGELPQDEARIEQIRRMGEARGEGCLVDLADWGAALLNNANGRYPRALAAAERASAWHRIGSSGLALAELVEAASRCRRPDIAEAAAATFADRHGAAMTTPWALGTQAYLQAMIHDGDDAEDRDREAVRLLAHPEVFVTLRGRGHLLYGEWLRRRGRRNDAREQLQQALDLFTRTGARGFATRTARELRATGARPSTARSGPAGTELSEQERLVAKLARTGATTKEIAAGLFLSPRTVDAHLRSIFRKLEISSRRELRDRQL